MSGLVAQVMSSKCQRIFTRFPREIIYETFYDIRIVRSPDSTPKMHRHIGVVVNPLYSFVGYFIRQLNQSFDGLFVNPFLRDIEIGS